MEEVEMDYDVIVIGARVAGCLVASLLGDRGCRVLVLERTRFPSATLSTHFFRAPAFRAFAQMGVVEDVLAAAPQLKVNYNVIDGTAFPEPVDRPDDYPFYMCLRRITLDNILASHTRRPTVEFREGAKVTDLLREAGRVVGVSWQEADGKREARARAVIGADGVHSFVASQVNVQTEHHDPVRRAMYYTYYRGIAPNEGPAAEFHYNGNKLAYCFPTDDGLTLMALSIPIDEFPEFKRDAEKHFEQELNAMLQLAPRLDRATRDDRVQGTGSIAAYLRVPYGDGWALVGDAGMVMDPWSGQGIDQAATHAVILAEYIGGYLAGENDWLAAMEGYHRERNAFSHKAYRRTSSFSSDLTPMTREALQRRGLIKSG
jgi:2-polyprenyl-6-methoxyphenol hydroxylase-like FAD-dependent oxidoreductase